MTTATVTLSDLVAVTAGRAQHVIEEDRRHVLYWAVPDVKPDRAGYRLYARLTIRYVTGGIQYWAELSESWDKFTGNTHTPLLSSLLPGLRVTVLERPATRFSFAKWTEFVRDARKAVRTLKAS